LRNILRAISAGQEKSLAIVGFTGRIGGEMASRRDLCRHAPSDSTQLIQQIHITAGHIIRGLVEDRLYYSHGSDRNEKTRSGRWTTRSPACR